MSTTRSPSYPQRSLAEAVRLIEGIYASEKAHPASNEALVQAMGYKTLNGNSRSALATLKRYSFLEKTTDGLHKLSSISIKVLFPVDANDRKIALKSAFLSPSILQDMVSRYGDDLPSDTTMRNYLMSVGYVDSAAEEIVQVYKESLEYLKTEDVNFQKTDDLFSAAENAEKANTVESSTIPEDSGDGREVIAEFRALPSTASQTILEDMVVKVSRNASVHIRFMGEYSRRSIDILIRYLEVMKDTLDLDKNVESEY